MCFSIFFFGFDFKLKESLSNYIFLRIRFLLDLMLLHRLFKIPANLSLRNLSAPQRLKNISENKVQIKYLFLQQFASS